MRLEIGQIVQLKSGGPEMTIVDIGTDAGQQQIECTWSDGQTQHSAHFPADALDTVRKLRLSQTNRWIGGVCGGIGEYLGVDANVVRLVWVILVFVTAGVAVAAYVATWIFLSWAMRRR
jgi:phage shock protein C